MTRPPVATTSATLNDLHHGRPVILVPTMGGLHAGHLALVDKAQQLAQDIPDAVVCVSIFVNALQFAANEDFATYPRQLEADLDQLVRRADTCFAPDSAVIYPQAQEIFVHSPRLGALLCGRNRPEHFSGVLTVVHKLFSLTGAQRAVFGRKDFQQLQLIRLMVTQLHLPIVIDDVPVIREPDMLACSSRNAILDAQQRKLAPLLYTQLNEAANAIALGTAYHTACANAANALQAAGFDVDYVACCDNNLAPPQGDTKHCVVLGAASLGAVRLIDNVVIPA